jgi:hypothetical protein
MSQKFTEVHVKENKTVSLKCPVTNPQFVDIEWLQDGQPVIESSHFHVRFYLI